MQEHCRKKDHGRVKNGNLTIDKYIESQDPAILKGVIITVGYMCWNTEKASVEGAIALANESRRLGRMGIRMDTYILDNGSDDNTSKLLQLNVGNIPGVYLFREPENRGISIGRNILINLALTSKPDYHLMLDGDIEIVPLSVYQMVRYLECHQELGCIGAYSSNYTTIRSEAARCIFEIPENRVKHDIKIAWTQYGLFRACMLSQGLRFDCSGPFGEPGWGFEDDDFYYQMMEAGFDSKYFGGMCYLHRNIRSSWPSLQKKGVDVEAMFKKRQEFLINKWSKKGLNSAILRSVSAQHVPIYQ